MKLYPPYIEGTIPAFYKDSRGTVTLTVPFSMNRAVNVNEVVGFQAKIKTVQSNTYLLTLKTMEIIEYDMEDKYEVYFRLSEEEEDVLCIGEYYKVQLAYIGEDGSVGYYSTVGVTKFTTKPIVKIEKLTQYTTNAHDYVYTGLYRQYQIDSETGENIKDTTEKEYSYQFIITDKAGNIIDDTGIQIHNNEKDVEPYESIDEYNYYSDIPNNLIYYIQYIVYTNNNLTVKSPKYKLTQKTSIPPEIQASIEATMNFDNGYVDVHLIGDLDEEGHEIPTNGAFLITRACSDDHFNRWVEVFKFTLHGQQPSLKLLRDFTVEQGKEYIYALQQYNDFGLYSERLLSNTIMGDFEDIFLFDGERQLKIKYNPKISSFKTNILETKIDTIGMKYPFIFRNGKVAYKEFPISGLISYLGDEENLFITDDELGLTEGYANVKRPATLDLSVSSSDEEFFWQFNNPNTSAYELREKYKKIESIQELMKTAKPRTTQLVDYNVSAERTFKLAVLEWLNNGKIKLFRSPSEGNYLVRLMNVSLTPEDRVSRMIHSFQATAYEMMEFSYENMLKENIIFIKQPDLTQLRWEGLQFATDINPYDDRYTKIGNIWYLQGDILVSHHAARTVRFDGMVPGSIVYVRTKGNDMESIEIGTTGSYQVDIGMEIDVIRVPNNAQYQGTVTYSYHNDAQNVFNTVKSVDVIEYLGQQYIGEQSNIIDQINNIKFHLLQFFYLHFDKRYIENYGEEISDPYPLYLEKVDTLLDNIYAIKEVDNSIVERDLIVDPNSPEIYKVASIYYYINTSMSLVPARNTVYNEGRTYYTKEQINVYHDLAHPGLIIVDQDSYNNMALYIERTNRSMSDLLSVQLLSYKKSIDGHILDLDEIEEFNIDENILFDSIELDNGAVMECGYQLQDITYSIEDSAEVKNTIVNIGGNQVNLSQMYNEYMNYLSAEYFYELREGNITDQIYATNVANAREEMPAVYPAYMTLIEERLQYEEENNA